MLVQKVRQKPHYYATFVLVAATQLIIDHGADDGFIKETKSAVKSRCEHKRERKAVLPNVCPI